MFNFGEIFGGNKNNDPIGKKSEEPSEEQLRVRKCADLALQGETNQVRINVIEFLAKQGEVIPEGKTVVIPYADMANPGPERKGYSSTTWEGKGDEATREDFFLFSQGSLATEKKIAAAGADSVVLRGIGGASTNINKEYVSQAVEGSKNEKLVYRKENYFLRDRAEQETRGGKPILISQPSQLKYFLTVVTTFDEKENVKSIEITRVRAGNPSWRADEIRAG